jgi:autotransporter translocation and assembly factor TamB
MKAGGLITAISDFVIVDREEKKKKMAIDTNIFLLFGDKFCVESEGLHITLGGEITAKGSNLVLDGQVMIAKGYYEHYGIRINIVRRLAIFKEEPT